MKTLVVDDDGTVREILKNFIESQGHQVSFCCDAESAWEACWKERYPLMILDWRLPGMDGLDLCRQIRRMPKGDQSMIVMISAHQRPEDIQALSAAGADEFLPKPLDLEHLKLVFRLAARQFQFLDEQRERSVRLEIIEQIAKAVGSTLEPRELFRTILFEIRKAIPCDRAVISRIESDRKEFFHWYIDSELDMEPVQVGQSEQAEWFVREIYEPKRAKLIPDIQGGDLPIFRHLKKAGLGSMLIVPILQNEIVTAHIGLSSRKANAFTTPQMELLSAISVHLGSAIRNVTLFLTAEQRFSRLAALQNLNRQIAENLNLSGALKSISDAAESFFGGATTIRLREGDDLMLIAGSGEFFLRENRKRLRIGESISGAVAATGEPYISSQFRSDERLITEHRENLLSSPFGSLMSLPFRAGQRVVGVLNVYREEGHGFSEEDQRLAMSLADQAAIAIENARLHGEERKSRQFLDSVLDMAADAIITIDEGGIVESFNRAAEKMFGYGEGEIVGKSISLLTPDAFWLLEGGDVERFIAKDEKYVIASGRKVTGVRRNGDKFPMELGVSEVRMDGRLKFTAIVRDITERERSERNLTLLNQTLDEKNKELETVFHVASHDLRSPLVNIQGYSRELSYLFESVRSYLEEKGNTEKEGEALKVWLEEEIPEALQYVTAGAARMDILLSGLLRYTRLGHAALDIGPVDMNEMLKNIMASLEFQITESGADLTIEELPVCVADAIQIHQVFTNLIDNAAKYLDPSRPGKIRVSGEIRAGEAIYRVRDNGIGISKGDEKKVFEIFRRLDHAAAPGEGLGLAITHRILGRLNGRIWVASERGKGSDFFVALPAAENAVERKEEVEHLHE